MFILRISEKPNLTFVSSWELLKYCFKQMDKNFWIVSVSSDPFEDISPVIGLTLSQASRAKNSRTTTHSEVMVDTKSNPWIICCDDPFNAAIKPRTMLENLVLSAEVPGADFLPLLRRKNKPE